MHHVCDRLLHWDIQAAMGDEKYTLPGRKNFSMELLSSETSSGIQADTSRTWGQGHITHMGTRRNIGGSDNKRLVGVGLYDISSTQEMWLVGYGSFVFDSSFAPGPSQRRGQLLFRVCDAHQVVVGWSLHRAALLYPLRPC